MTGNQDPSFERIHPDDAVGCAAAEAACRRWHNLTLTLLGTLADSGRTSFADDRRLFMAWQVTRLLAPSWNEPPAWFVQRHIENKRDIERKGVQAEGGRGGLWSHRRSNLPMKCDQPQVSNLVMHEFAGRSSVRGARIICWLGTRAMQVLVLLGHALQVISPRSVTDVRQRRITMRYTAFGGWPPGHPAGDVLVTSGDHVHDKHCLGWELDPRRVLEAA